MTYPPQDAVQSALRLFNGEYYLRRTYRLTGPEISELDRYGAVREATRVWADDLRTRCPRFFTVVKD
jgi:hypothetical protein